MTCKREEHYGRIILLQDVFLISFLVLLVVGFARGEFLPTKTIEKIVRQTVLDAYEELS